LFKPFNKIFLTVLIFFTALGLLFGGYFFYKHFFVNQPLSLTLDNSALIAKYELVSEGKKPIIKLQLNKVDDLAYEFPKFLTTSGQILTEKDLELELASHPNAKLLKFYQEINPALYEALSLGNYTNLQNVIAEKNSQYGLTKVNLGVSENYIYLQMEDNEDYLYYILNKNNDSFPKIINNIGSDVQ
jgi:hypothetical protein